MMMSASSPIPACALLAVWTLLLLLLISTMTASPAAAVPLPSTAGSVSPVLLPLNPVRVTPADLSGVLMTAAGASSSSRTSHYLMLPGIQKQQQTQLRPRATSALLQDSRPFTIAHRGASGLLPEHTLAAYTTAIAHGADFIECDVVMTKDLQLICRHEPNLNTTSNAWTLFPDRAATYTIDGENVTGIFACDLTLAEVQQLSARQRWAFRAQVPASQRHAIPTFQQFLDTALAADRPVGIYPEVKHPTWHNQLAQVQAAGTSIEQLMVQELHSHGYGASAPLGSAAWRAQPVLIQSFEASSLKRLSGMTRMPLVLLMGGWPGFTAPDSNLTHEQMTTDDFLADLATFAAGVGPWKSSLYTVVTSSSSSSGAHGSGSGGHGAAITSAAASGSEAANSSHVVAAGAAGQQQDCAGGSSSSSNSGGGIGCVQFVHPDIGRKLHPGAVGGSSNNSNGSSSSSSPVQIVSTGLVAKLHKHGLAVHPYTLRDEQQFVLDGCGDIACEFSWLFDHEGVDGGFADYPGTLANWLLARQRVQLE